jgi:biopolymer transport protein ExbD
MRFNVVLLVLILCLCVTAAFAGETTSVNIPFGFESHGEHFPASQYEVRLSDDHHHLTMSTRENPAKSVFLLVTPAITNQYAATVSIRFDNSGGVHELRSLRLGSYEYKH